MPRPAAVTAVAEGFGRDMPTATVQVEHRTGIRWRITVSTDRVRMWVDYETRSRGRLLMKASQLFIDGEQAPRADSYSQLVSMMSDAGRQETTSAEEISEVAVEADICDAPEEVRRVYRKWAAMSLPDLRLVSRRQGRRWSVCLENERIQLTANFEDCLMNPQRPMRDPATRLSHKEPVTLIIDGADLTDKVQGRLDRALAMMAAHQSAPRDPAVAGESAAAVNTGVQVRRQSVIRV